MKINQEVIEDEDSVELSEDVEVMHYESLFQSINDWMRTM
jgi:hypothetical protein